MYKTKKRPVIKLRFPENYETYRSFMEQTKPIIYDAIFNSFNKLLKFEHDEVEIEIEAIINGIEWGTEFIFNKEDTIVLERDLVSYYAENEEYEKCSEIKKMVNELKKI